MRRATFLKAALRDLVDIHTYLVEASGSVSVGEGFVAKLRDKCHKLAALQSILGRARPEIRIDVRSVPFDNYVIFFRYESDRFEVVNILERHKDFESHFRAHRPNE